MQRRPFTEAIRRAVEERARFRCEYCHQRLTGDRPHIDHIIPGLDDLANYALACSRCNENKRELISFPDPVTGRSIRLFNPRSDQWDDHFHHYRGYVVGRTAIGRATAVLLFRQTSADIPAETNWTWSQRVGNPDIAQRLSVYRGWRLANRFQALERIALNDPSLDLGGEDHRLYNLSLAILRAEACMMRSQIGGSSDDLRQGIRIVSHALRTFARTRSDAVELLQIRSILFQQFATTLALAGAVDQATKLQSAAVRSHAIGLTGQALPWFTASIRKRSLASKYVSVSAVDTYTRDELGQAIVDGERGEVRSLVYIADLELARHKPGRLAERLLSSVEERLFDCGYGQDFDYATPIVLRRRWWALRAWVYEPLDHDLLKEDLRFWRRIKMYNEGRELNLLFRRILTKQKSTAAVDALRLLSTRAKHTANRSAVGDLET